MAGIVASLLAANPPISVICSGDSQTITVRKTVSTVAKEWTPTSVFDILADERVRSILAATNTRTRSVQDLTRVCEGSQSAIYRRVSVLVEYGLLKEQTNVDSDGHHYSVYRPNFENIDIRLDGENVILTVHLTEGSSSQYTEQFPNSDEEKTE